MTSNRRTLPLLGNSLVFGVILTGVLIYLVYMLYIDWSLGGNSWKQGDWLIHGGAGPIRRGPFGTGLVILSDALGASPLALLIWLQGLIVTLIFVVVGAAAFKLGVPDKLLIVLLSPAFLVLFWFNDPQGSMRKEILAYLAFLPLIVAAIRGHGTNLALVLSTTAYGIAVIAHEGNVFFLPFLWIAMWLVLPTRASLSARIAVITVPGLLALGAGIWATAHPNVADTGLMCMQLTQRGLDSSICDGAIAYLATTPQEGRMHPGRLLSMHFRSFLLIYAACLISFRVLFQGSPHLEPWFIAVVASGLAFLPLYLLAGDYGRWLSFHVSSVLFVLLIWFLKRRPAWLYEAPRRLDFSSLLALSVIVGVSHSPGEMADGFFVTLSRAVYSLVS